MRQRPARRRRRTAAVATVLVAVSLAGCSSYSGTTAEKVREWVSENSFVANYDQVVSDISLVDEAVKTSTAKVVRTLCDGLVSDVGTAYLTLPTPEGALTHELNAADLILGKAAQGCSGVSSVSSSRMQADLARFRTGIADLARAQRLLTSFGVTWKVHL